MRRPPQTASHWEESARRGRKIRDNRQTLPKWYTRLSPGTTAFVEQLPCHLRTGRGGGFDAMAISPDGAVASEKWARARGTESDCWGGSCAATPTCDFFNRLLGLAAQNPTQRMPSAGDYSRCGARCVVGRSRVWGQPGNHWSFVPFAWTSNSIDASPAFWLLRSAIDNRRLYVPG